MPQAHLLADVFGLSTPVASTQTLAYRIDDVAKGLAGK